MSLGFADWVGAQVGHGRYHINAKLGEGGMGFVYHAWDANLEMDVVVKVPRPAALSDPDFSQRFAREIRSLVRLRHPHIVDVLDVGLHEGLPFAVMLFLSGQSLDDRRGASGNAAAPMPVATLSAWLPAVADALDFIHRQNYVHRDVKPANILFDAHGNAYLSDFGVAKVLGEMEDGAAAKSLTGTGMVLGTPHYMAPELILGQQIDGRIDQYALAVTVHECLSGRPPIDGPTGAAVLVQQTLQPPPALNQLIAGVPPELAAAVLRGLSKDPRQRFACCADFAKAALASETSAGPVRPATVVPPPIVLAPPPRPTIAAAAVAAAIPTTSMPAAGAAPASDVRGSARERWRQLSRRRRNALVTTVICVCLISAALLMGGRLAQREVKQPVAKQDVPPPPPPDHVMPLIEKWKTAADSLEKNLIVSSAELLANPDYDSAADLKRKLDAAAQERRRVLSGKLTSLRADLKAIHQAFDERRKLLAKGNNDLAPLVVSSVAFFRSGFGNRAAERRPSDAERQLDEQANEIARLDGRMNDLERRLGSLSYQDAAASQELAVLEELEKDPDSWQSVSLSEPAANRGRQYLALVKNPRLAFLALCALTRAKDGQVIADANAKLNTSGYSRDQHRQLLQAMVVGRDPQSLHLAMMYIKLKPEVLAGCDLDRLLSEVENHAGDWLDALAAVAKRCDTPQNAERFFRVLCEVRADEMVTWLVDAVKKGPLKEARDTVAAEIVRRAWKAAYPVVDSLLPANENQSPLLNDVDAAALDACASDSPTTGLALAEHLLIAGDTQQTLWAVRYFGSHDTFTKVSCHDRLRQPPVLLSRAAILSLFLQASDAKSLDAAQWMIDTLDDIAPEQIEPGLSRAALDRETLKRKLVKRLLKSGRDGAGLALSLLFGEDLPKHLVALKAKRPEQLAAGEAVLELLSTAEPNPQAESSYSNYSMGRNRRAKKKEPMQIFRITVKKSSLKGVLSSGHWHAHRQAVGELASEIIGQLGALDTTGLTGITEVVDEMRSFAKAVADESDRCHSLVLLREGAFTTKPDFWGRGDWRGEESLIVMMDERQGHEFRAEFPVEAATISKFKKLSEVWSEKTRELTNIENRLPNLRIPAGNAEQTPRGPKTANQAKPSARREVTSAGLHARKLIEQKEVAREILRFACPLAPDLGSVEYAGGSIEDDRFRLSYRFSWTDATGFLSRGFTILLHFDFDKTGKQVKITVAEGWRTSGEPFGSIEVSPKHLRERRELMLQRLPGGASGAQRDTILRADAKRLCELYLESELRETKSHEGADKTSAVSPVNAPETTSAASPNGMLPALGERVAPGNKGLAAPRQDPPRGGRTTVGAPSGRVTASIPHGVDRSRNAWLNKIDTIDAVNDGVLPKNSRDQNVQRFTWWPHRGSVEWIEYEFAESQVADGAEVYWFDDTPDGGECKPPRGWRLLYRNGNRWQPVAEASGYPLDIDRVCRTRFKAVKTSGLRLEVRLQNGLSAGLFEWRVISSNSEQAR